MSNIVLDNTRVSLSNENKLMYPDDGLTKGDVVEYYYNISDYMMPFLSGRPLIIERFPNGIYQKRFFQKTVSEYFPTWIDTITVELVEEHKDAGILVDCNKKSTLIYLVNKACLSFHTWLSRKDKIRFPDKIVLGLYPPDENFEITREGALEVKRFFDKLNINIFAMTTGSAGLHVIIPVKPHGDFDEIMEIAKRFATMIEKISPNLFTTGLGEHKKHNKLLLDFTQNAYAWPVITPYSLRPLKGAPVAAPVTWEELEDTSSRTRVFNINNIFEKLQNQGDPFKHLDAKSHSINELIRKSSYLVAFQL